ncbi:hypothetical protein Sjap_012850 [Stephania japonica]|uniref:Choline transporter-like protein n=1 Tax=Stephania japonica TaxID=461633 RepID=A0AAP0NY25_9MAGN
MGASSPETTRGEEHVEEVEERRRSKASEGDVVEKEKIEAHNNHHQQQQQQQQQQQHVGNVVDDMEAQNREFRFAKLQNLNPSNPLRIVIQGASTARTPPPQHHIHRHHHHQSQPQTPQSQQWQQQQQQQQQQPPPPPPIHIPTPPPSFATLNSRRFTNKISLFLFAVHAAAAAALICFLVFKAIQGVLKTEPNDISITKEKRVLRFWLPQVESSAIISIILALIWQKAIRTWPKFMIKFILWSSFATTLTSGVLLLCFQMPSTNGVGVALVLFSVGSGLYSCWVNRRTGFATRILTISLEPVSKFPDLIRPVYYILGFSFILISFWVLAVIGALNFYYPAVVVIGLVLSLAWTAEVMRNVANLTVSRVIGLYYLRGMESNTKFCLQRAMSWNLGSACLGSLFMPTIEFLRIIARGLNLLEGEDEFMFSCAHCCLSVMESIFRYGNGWAFVQVAAYGKGFTRASLDTWDLFVKQGMEPIVDSDVTSALCFLTGVCSGSICVISMASWTFATHKSFTATVSLLVFFIGYLLTRIAMALPHACVSCYYVCYAEDPTNRMFDGTIRDRINAINEHPEILVPTPRVPHRLTGARTTSVTIRDPPVILNAYVDLSWRLGGEY